MVRLVLSLAVLVLLAIGAFVYLGEGAPPQVLSVPDAERGIPDLAGLVHDADLVVVGSVSGPGTTSPPQTPSQGNLPSTRFPISVERAVRGTDTTPGSTITVIQAGGTVNVPVLPMFPNGPTRARVIQFEDDTLMSPGARYVLFLQRAPGGAFSVVGGAQGRLTIDAQNLVHPLHTGIPPTRDHDGQALDSFLRDVAAIA